MDKEFNPPTGESPDMEYLAIAVVAKVFCIGDYDTHRSDTKVFNYRYEYDEAILVAER